MYLLRQHYPYRNPQLSKIDWILKNEWKESYDYFIKTISNYLSQIDNIDLTESNKITKEAFYKYFTKDMEIFFNRKK